LRGSEGGGFGFEEVERVGDEVGRVVDGSAGELLLEALFEGGIEGERLGVSIPLVRSGRGGWAALPRSILKSAYEGTPGHLKLAKQGEAT
jgi:hypothetical protein